MASGIFLLSTLLVMLAVLTLYRVLLLYYHRKQLSRKDVGRAEERMRARWRLGAVLVLTIGVLALFVQVALAGVNMVSPIIDSIELGAIYAIMGIGLTLTYAVVRIPNFAHGEMATLGAYTMAYSYTVWNYPMPLAFAAAAGAGAGLGLLQHNLVFRPMISRGAKIVQIMIGSLGLSLILRGVFWMFAALGDITSYHPISESLLRRYEINFFDIIRIPIHDCGGICRLGESAVTSLFFWVIIAIVPLVILMHLLLTRTLIGKSMRAVADNIELSQVTGINVEHIRQITWLLTGALTGLGGAFLGIEFPIWPELGWTSLLRVFAAVTIGGLVSFYGTIAGGLIVGFGELWVTIVGANFDLSPSWQPFTVFLIIVVVLLIRPAGLSGLSLPKPKLYRVRNVLNNFRLKRSDAEGSTSSS